MQEWQAWQDTRSEEEILIPGFLCAGAHKEVSCWRNMCPARRAEEKSSPLLECTGVRKESELLM